MQKLSRGKKSALGAVVGLASRAPLTIFDETYLGMDVPTRNLFYDALLADYAEVPRTIVLSTHLVSEVSALLEEVIILDEGRLVTQAPVDSLRGRGASIVGPAALVDKLTADLAVLAEQRLGGTKSTTVLGDLDDTLLAKARSSKPRDRSGRPAGTVRPSDRLEVREGEQPMSAAATLPGTVTAGLRLRRVLQTFIVGVRPIIVGYWLVMLATFLLGGLVVQFFGNGIDHSMWDYGTQSPKYFSAAIGITVTPALFALMVSHGITRRMFAVAMRHLPGRRGGFHRADLGARLPGGARDLRLGRAESDARQPTSVHQHVAGRAHLHRVLPAGARARGHAAG